MTTRKDQCKVCTSSYHKDWRKLPAGIMCFQVAETFHCLVPGPHKVYQTMFWEIDGWFGSNYGTIIVENYKFCLDHEEGDGEKYEPESRSLRGW